MESNQYKLFVGGISRDTSEEALMQHFSKYGVVSGAVVCKDKDTGAPRCFGFVRFVDASSAVKALRDSHVILGRTVDVKKAVPRGGQLQSQQRQQQQTSGVHEPTSNGNHRTKKIFVGGLSSAITEEEFKGYFERFGRITDVVVMHDSVTNRPRGFGFVTFDSEDSVENVMQNNFHKLSNKHVEVKRAIPKEGIRISNSSNQNSRFGVGREFTCNSSQSGQYPLDTAGYGMVHYSSMSYNGVQGFPYPMGPYGYGYYPTEYWSSPMMPVTYVYSPHYNSGFGYFAYMSNAFNQPGLSPTGYNTLVGSESDGKLNQVNYGHEQVSVDVLSPVRVFEIGGWRCAEQN